MFLHPEKLAWQRCSMRSSSAFQAEAKLIYAGRSGFVTMAQASSLGADVASANWHATAAIVAKLAGDGLFVDMGSTTTDLIAIRDGAVANRRLLRCRAPADRRTRLHRIHTHLPLQRSIVGAGARTADAAHERILRLHGGRAPDHGSARRKGRQTPGRRRQGEDGPRFLRPPCTDRRPRCSRTWTLRGG